jgi:hypothetical protein
VFTVEITYTEQDYLRAVRFMSRRQSLLFSAFIAVGVLALGFMLYRANYSEMAWWVKPAFVGWLTFFVILFRMFQFRKIAKQLKGAPSAQGVHVWTVSDEGITVVGPLTAGNIKWEAIVKAREGKSDLFFYTTKSFALFLPKRVFTNEGQLFDLRGLLAEKLGPRAQLIQRA